jgi:hypothetical protein
MMTVVFIFALSLIGKYFIFEKMGMPGWKSLIPIYSDYLLFRELIGSGYFWGYIASALLAGSCSALVTIGMVSGVMEFLFIITAVAACTVTIAIQIKLAHSLSKSFGHGIGYTFGLIFIEPIMLMILGLGNNRYARAAA